MNGTTTKSAHSASRPAESDYVNIDAFLGHVLDGCMAGTLTKGTAIGAVTHVIAASAHSADRLAERDYVNIDAFLGHVLDSCMAGTLTKGTAIGAVTHVIAAIDQGDHDEARRWFEEGRKCIASGR